MVVVAAEGRGQKTEGISWEMHEGRGGKQGEGEEEEAESLGGLALAGVPFLKRRKSCHALRLHVIG